MYGDVLLLQARAVLETHQEENKPSHLTSWYGERGGSWMTIHSWRKHCISAWTHCYLPWTLGKGRVTQWTKYKYHRHSTSLHVLDGVNNLLLHTSRWCLRASILVAPPFNTQFTMWPALTWGNCLFQRGGLLRKILVPVPETACLTLSCQQCRLTRPNLVTASLLGTVQSFSVLKTYC